MEKALLHLPPPRPAPKTYATPSTAADSYVLYYSHHRRRPLPTTLPLPHLQRATASFFPQHLLAIHDQSSSSRGSHYFRVIRSKFKDEQFARRALVLAGVAAVVVWNFETVPYSSRWHLILLTTGLERKLGEMAFEDTKNAKHYVLPLADAESVKVRKIATKILRAMDEELKKGREGELGRGAMIKHLKGIKWEVVVVRDWQVNAFCLPGGKIVVCTGLLDRLKEEGEIATVIGHEVHKYKYNVW